MVLLLEVLTGPLGGQKFKVTPGLTIGRRVGSILLGEDPKVSGLHAKIEKDNKDQFVLLDQESANGLIHQNRRVKKIAIMPGVKFRIGETHFQVIETLEKVDVPPPPPRTWREQIKDFLRKDPGDNSLKPRQVKVFTPHVVLEFVQGMQTDQEITLGYGQRVAGLGHLDIDLWDPDAPENAFELHPGPGLALFRDLSHGKVRINGKACHDEEMPLQDGDQISIGGTVISVRYP